MNKAHGRMLLLCVAALLLVACGAQAAQISYTTGFGPADMDWLLPYIPVSANFQQFTPAMGTLQSISIELSGTMHPTFQLTAPQGTGGYGTLTTTGDLTMDLCTPDSYVSDDTGDFVGTVLLRLDLPNVGPLVIGDRYHRVTVDTSVSSTTSATVTGSVTDFGLFTGTGTAAIPLFTNGWASVSGGGATLGWANDGFGSATITYTYVPEPGSMLAMLSLLGGAGFMFRRRRA
jgi:hypothetical protein